MAVLRLRFLPLLTLLAILLSMAACNKDVPLGELDAFVQRIGELPAQEALDTLYSLVDAPAPMGGFARYQLGTLFYNQATDSASSRGWNDPYVHAFLDSAELWLSAALAADSTMIRAYVNLGALWDDRAEMMLRREERDHRIDQAKVFYEKALELEPHNEKARCNLGTLYKRQNDLERAVQEYLAVLEHNPRSALARYNLAIVFATQRIYREAKIEFELAVKYDPDGDIGDRSRHNLQIINDLLESEKARREQQ